MDHNEQLISLLTKGEVCVIPTDTVYGVVGKLSSPEAVAKIYQLKQRDQDKAVGTILAASIAQVATLTTKNALKLASEFWPGPTSVIVPADETFAYAHKGEKSLAVRIPADPILRALLVQTGPLASSSANLQGQEPATTVDEAKAYFHDAIPLYIDGGDLSDRTPSRIVRIDEDGLVTVVRP
jgi:tRNA threonylcarbamoyl adenosine modification protein (Sua5/YciO/YrdC/YwlC family)